MIYLLKKLGYLSCGVSHCWDFADCIPVGCRFFSAYCKLVVGFRSLLEFRFDFGEIPGIEEPGGLQSMELQESQDTA